MHGQARNLEVPPVVRSEAQGAWSPPVRSSSAFDELLGPGSDRSGFIAEKLLHGLDSRDRSGSNALSRASPIVVDDQILQRDVLANFLALCSVGNNMVQARR